MFFHSISFFFFFFFFFNDTATTEIYTLSLHDALPISNTKRSAMSSVGNQWAQTDPKAAMAFAQNLPAGNTRNSLMGNIVGQWFTAFICALPGGIAETNAAAYTRL